MTTHRLSEHALERAVSAYSDFMTALGLDLDDEHLTSTPRRVAMMFGDELFVREPVRFTTFAAESHDLIIVRDIPFGSTCAHHFLPFVGICHVGYIPGKRMVGLSKLARVVDYFSHAPQVQERLTAQIAHYLHAELEADGVGVVMQAEHQCMTVRGVAKPGAVTVTSALEGSFRQPELRAEFLALVR